MMTNLDKLLAGQSTVAGKIRALNAAGMARADIARTLGKRYQHVRNVLEEPASAASPGVSDRPRPFEGPRSEPKPTPAKPAANPSRRYLRFPVAEDGWVQLPPEIAQRLGLLPGGVVVGEVGEETLTLLSRQESMRRAKALIKPWKEGEPLLSEELIRERREEAAREDNE